MLIYEHERTEQIVSRLIKTEKIVRIVTVFSAAIVFAFGGYVFGLQYNYALIGLLLGAGIGFIIGQYSMLLVSGIIEWMGQLLIAEGEILYHVRKKL